jgi:D-beta-D-heptose 7-phosphate kinase/D-beta-D-heptose 1-phosphate adenosyltransferase
MKNSSTVLNKIHNIASLQKQMAIWKMLGKKIAFTNGCFDVLHVGHMASIADAAKEADYLIVGVNADASVKRLKGESRPLNNENDRSLLLASLLLVDAVIIFNEDTPLHLITTLLPDVLVKGGDYTIDNIVGAKEVIANGGKVIINPIVAGYSTTNTIEKMKQA